MSNIDSKNKKVSPKRKRNSVSGKERAWIGPKFNPLKNVPVLDPKPTHGPAVKMATLMAQIPLPMSKPKKQALTVYDYLDMSKMVGRFNEDELGGVSGFSTFRSQFAGDFTHDNETKGVESNWMNMNDSRVCSPIDRDGRPASHGSGLGGLSGDHLRPGSPSSVNDGIHAACTLAQATRALSQGGMTHWEMKQEILAENWLVIQRWEAKARESGSLVGVSHVGRKLQKIQPSKRVRIPGVDPPEPKIAQASLESLGLQKVESAAEFANLSRWRMGLSNPDSKLAHMRCVQSIVVREALLLQLDKTLEDIEQKYYKYALLRLQSADLGIPVNSEQLVVKKAVVLTAQVELRVALANYRTATIQVFEELIKWRNICRKYAKVKDANIVLMWHGENYLLKMTHDTSKLYWYSVLRMWLDFEPNMLMLPPQQLAASNMQINDMAHSSSGTSVGSSLSGGNGNVNNSFLGLPGQLSPLGGTADDDLISQVSEVSQVNFRTYFQTRSTLFTDWLDNHKAFLAVKRQEFLKRRRADEQVERDLRNAQEMVDHEVKRIRAARAKDRYELEEKEKREKNFKILKMHQQRIDAGEDPDKVKESKSREEAGLDATEVALKQERDAEERAIQAVESEEKAQRDAAYKEERDLKAKLQRDLEESRINVGIASILSGSAGLIEENVEMNDNKEWRLLRNVCLASWKCTTMPNNTRNEDGTINYYGYDDAEAKTVWEQGVHVAPLFWGNFDISPLVVEAATGFRELWPRGAPIVPPLPEKLFRTCSEYRRFFALEKKKLSKLQERKYGGQSLREKVANLGSLVYFDTHGLMEDQDQSMGLNTATLTSSKASVRMNDDEDFSEIEQQRLRERQESDGNLVDGTLRIYREIANLNPKRIGEASASLRSSRSGANGKYQMLKFNTVTVTQSTDNLFTNSTTVMKTESTHNDSQMYPAGLGDDGHGGDTFAMTRAEESYDEGCSNPPAMHPLQDERPVSLTGTMHPTGLNAITTKPLKLSEAIVSNERWLLGRDRFGLPMIRPEQRHRRPPDYTRPYWQFRLCVRIQSLIRGFTTRNRLMRAKRAVHVMQCIVKIQSHFRRCVGVKLYELKKVQFQIDIEVMRKAIIKKHMAALCITQFIRHCGSINTGAVALNPMLAYAKSAARAREAAKLRKLKRGMEYSQTTTITNADGSMTVKRVQTHGSATRSPDSSPIPSRNEPRGGNARCGSRGRACSPNSRGTTSYGQATAGEFGADLADTRRTEDKKGKVKLANIFKAEKRNGSRLIPITVKPGALASQPGTRKPRFRPFRALSREFIHDVHLPPAEKTVKHPNDCYRAPPALLTAKERDISAKELAAKAAIGNEDGVANINKAKFEAMRDRLRAAMQHKF